MKTSAIRDRVTDDKSFSCPHILIPHGCKLCLEGSKGPYNALLQSDLHTHRLMEVKRDKLVILSIDACPPPRGHTLPTQFWDQYLPSCIQNVQVGRLIVNADPDLVCILYRREEHTCGKKQGSENLPHRRGSPVQFYSLILVEADLKSRGSNGGRMLYPWAIFPGFSFLRLLSGVGMYTCKCMNAHVCMGAHVHGDPGLILDFTRQLAQWSLSLTVEAGISCKSVSYQGSGDLNSTLLLAYKASALTSDPSPQPTKFSKEFYY